MAVFKRRWFMWDFARQRSFDRDEFSLVATKLSEVGFNGIGLYLEGAFELKCVGGGILRKGIMTREDAKWVKEKCKSLGMEVFPMTNVVGHMEHFFRQERFRHLGPKYKYGCLDLNFTLPEAEEFSMNIIDDYLEAFDTKYIHIGGDEVALTPETRPLFAKFLASICDKLLSRGVTPAIWNDMLWNHKELCEPFSRDVEIFDWHYFSHRAESIKFFNEQGFKKVIACPCDNSWIGFSSHQMTCLWIRGEQIPVESDAIEALFRDNIKEGDPENLMGLHTHWEDTMGRDLWGQWSTFARSGMFMRGEFDEKPCTDKTLEMALFGRITPYTEIMHIIQNEIHSLFKHPYHASPVRSALFVKERFEELPTTVFEQEKGLSAKTVAPIEKIDKLLGGWLPEGEFEKRCKAYLVSTSALMKAAFALYTALDSCDELYTTAAKLQFEKKAEAKELVKKFAERFSRAAELIKEYIPAHKAFIELVPTHTETDFIKLDNTLVYINNIIEILKELVDSPSFEMIPLPSIYCIIDHVTNARVIER